MKTFSTLLFCSIFLCGKNSAIAQSPSLVWQKTFGGSGNDVIHDIYPTIDGNYIVSGITDKSTHDVTCDLKGLHDVLVFKMKPDGEIIWQQCFGGSKEEANPYNRIIQTTDGGYLSISETWSDDFDATGHHGESDVLTTKLDAYGNIVWTKPFGGSKFDVPRRIMELPDGKYMVMSRSTSSDGDVPVNMDTVDFDAWVFVLDNAGNIISNNIYGGSGDDDLYSVLGAEDGTFIFAGHSSSTDGDLTGLDTDSLDGWILKTDEAGNIISSKVYGQQNNEEFVDAILTDDGGYIAFGHTGDPDMPVDKGEYHGDVDWWVVKFDNTGNVEWQGVYGGSYAEDFRRAVTTPDNTGYYLAGSSNSTDGDVKSEVGNGSDFWIGLLGLDGTFIWSLPLGGSQSDNANSITASGMVAGATTSNDGDVTSFKGYADGWVVQFSDLSPVENTINDELRIDVFPNPAFDIVSIKAEGLKADYFLKVTDILGQEIFSTKMKSDQIELKVMNWIPGLYNVIISDIENYKMQSIRHFEVAR